jgi:hypothetical protein
MNDVALEFAFELRVAIAPTVHIGLSGNEVRRFTTITGGAVIGPRLNGEILASGGDWSTARGQCTELDARYLLRAKDGAVIEILNRGFARGTRAVRARLARGEAVSQHEFYYRTQPVFRTDASAYRWLTETVFVGYARKEEGLVCIEIHALQ